MSDLLAALVGRLLPGRSDLDPSTARLAVHIGAIDVPVEPLGLGKMLLQVRRATPLEVPLAANTALMLKVELADGAVRADAPVEVVSCGRFTLLLRMMAAPLVLRRRVVRDHELADAVGAPRAVGA